MVDDRISRVRIIDIDGKLKKSTKLIEKKKYPSKYKLVYSDFGLYLMLPILFSTGLGSYLDSYFNTKPMFILSGIVLGSIFAIYNLYALLTNEDGSNRTPR
jgi:F0F1-type ATP synthase assembly protein I